MLADEVIFIAMVKIWPNLINLVAYLDVTIDE